MEKSLPEGLNVSLDVDMVWKDVKSGWMDIQRIFVKARPKGDHSETWQLSEESLVKYRSMAEKIGAEEIIAGEATLSDPVKGLAHCHKKFTWKASPGYVITKVVATDLRKDGKNGGVNVDLMDKETTGYITGLAARACKWRLQVYTLKVEEIA